MNIPFLLVLLALICAVLSEFPPLGKLLTVAVILICVVLLLR